MKIYRTLFMVVLAILAKPLLAQQPAIIKMSDLEHYLHPSQEEANGIVNDTLYVVNFWATWCRPCVAELPFFEQAREETAGKKVRFLYVSLDFAEDYESGLLPFLERRPLGGTVMLLDEPDYNSWIGLVSKAWTGSIPATVFVRSATSLYEFHEGDYDHDTLLQTIQDYLKN